MTTPRADPLMDGDRKVIRTCLVAAMVSAVVGVALWPLFGGPAPVVLLYGWSAAAMIGGAVAVRLPGSVRWVRALLVVVGLVSVGAVIFQLPREGADPLLPLGIAVNLLFFAPGGYLLVRSLRAVREVPGASVI